MGFAYPAELIVFFDVGCHFWLLGVIFSICGRTLHQKYDFWTSFATELGAEMRPRSGKWREKRDNFYNMVPFSGFQPQASRTDASPNAPGLHFHHFGMDFGKIFEVLRQDLERQNKIRATQHAFLCFSLDSLAFLHLCSLGANLGEEFWEGSGVFGSVWKDLGAFWVLLKLSGLFFVKFYCILQIMVIFGWFSTCFGAC